MIEEIDKNPGEYFHSFVTSKNMECGIIRLKPGQMDTQTPHSCDEIYYIINGSGYIEINEKKYKVKKNDIIFIPKDFSHRFHSNQVEMTILYVIA